jgi:hypothetical protein
MFFGSSPYQATGVVSCYLAVYGINLALIEALQAWLGGKILTQAILAFPMAILSYFLMSRLVFAKVATSGH